MARILIIDDDAGIRISLEHALKSVGHEVLLATNGKDGVRQYRQTPTDLIILDLFMPDQDGFETITVLRRDFPHVPIIVMSGNDASGALLSIARQLGAAGILAKPFDAETLLVMIKKVLRPKLS
jgi:DNA-binding response OmpR family regulator